MRRRLAGGPPSTKPLGFFRATRESGAEEHQRRARVGRLRIGAEDEVGRSGRLGQPVYLRQPRLCWFVSSGSGRKGADR
jgi:hypothetical protein